MKVKQVFKPDFDFICGYIGGFEDIPTQQDKFKPITDKTLYYKDENGIERKLEAEVYISNRKAKESLKKFEVKFVDCINLRLTEHHPYKDPTQLEVVMNIKMSEKRLQSVDVDNLAKIVLDFMKGKVFEDDSQVSSLFVAKDIVKDDIIPQVSGIMVGVRIINGKPSLLAGVKFYDFVKISDEEYNERNKKENNTTKD